MPTQGTPGWTASEEGNVHSNVKPLSCDPYSLIMEQPPRLKLALKLSANVDKPCSL